MPSFILDGQEVSFTQSTEDWGKNKEGESGRKWEKEKYFG